jgi:hypothetical protein
MDRAGTIRPPPQYGYQCHDGDGNDCLADRLQVSSRPGSASVK